MFTSIYPCLFSFYETCNGSGLSNSLKQQQQEWEEWEGNVITGSIWLIQNHTDRTEAHYWFTPSIDSWDQLKATRRQCFHIISGLKDLLGIALVQLHNSSFIRSNFKNTFLWMKKLQMSPKLLLTVGEVQAVTKNLLHRSNLKYGCEEYEIICLCLVRKYYLKCPGSR